MRSVSGLSRALFSLTLVLSILVSVTVWQAWAEDTDEDEPDEEAYSLLDGAAKVTADYLKNEMELNNAATAAILFELQQKSGFEPVSIADGDNVLGVCKWTGSRLRAFGEFCEKYYLNANTLTAQLKFMDYELRESFPEQYDIILNCPNDEDGLIASGEMFTEYLIMPEEDDEDIVIFRSDELVPAYVPEPSPMPDPADIVREGLPVLSREEYFTILDCEDILPEILTVRQAEIIVADFLRNEMRFNDAVAAGILANIYDESGFDTKAVGDNKTTFGICQWGQRRYRPFLQSCEYHEVSEYDLMAQLGLLQSELMYDYPTMMEYIGQCTDSVEGAKEAARLFCKNFEVPRSMNTQIKERQKLAEVMYYPMLKGLTYERLDADRILSEAK